MVSEEQDSAEEFVETSAGWKLAVGKKTNQKHCRFYKDQVKSLMEFRDLLCSLCLVLS